MISEIDSTISFVDTTEHYRYFFRHYGQSNYPFNAEKLDISQRKNKQAELFLRNGKYAVFVNPLAAFDKNTSYDLKAVEHVKQAIPEIKSTDSLFAKFSNEDVVVSDSIKENNISQKDTTKIDINNYVFQSEFKSKKKNKEQTVAKDSAAVNNSDETKTIAEETEPIKIQKDSAVFKLPKQRNYDLAFTADYIISQLDNRDRKSVV